MSQDEDEASKRVLTVAFSFAGVGSILLVGEHSTYKKS